MKKQVILIKISFTSLLLTVTSLFSPFALSEITLDGSMGTTGSLAGPDYQITENLGQRTGGNLFHSFGQFNINSAESATFSGSAGIKNVVSRVTGGQASTIDGAFRSTISGANIYFLNPSGVIFGENASLDVQGSFHASTADYLKFKEGVKFETGLDNANPLLTVASPEAFGFLDDSSAPITVSGGLNKVLKVPEGETLSLVAGDISINDRSLYAPSGQVALASAGSAGEVVFNESGIDTSSFSQGGKIHLSRLAENPVAIINDTMQIADIDVSADAAGKVVIRGGQMVMDNAYIWADTTDKDGGDIDIGLAGDLTINGAAEITGVDKTPQSGITAYTQGKGNAGNILLNVNDLKLTHGTRIDSNSTAISSGNGGDLLINANSILLEGNNSKAVPSLSIGTNGSGNAGNINATVADKLEVSGGAYIRSRTMAKGNAGSITLTSNSLDLHNGGGIINFIAETAEGNANNLTINATDSITLSNRGHIDILHNGQGKSGDLSITSNKLDVRNGSSISSRVFNSGDGGNVLIKASEIRLTNDATMLADDTGLFTTGIFSNIQDLNYDGIATGNSGNLTVKANNLTVSNGAIISINNDGHGIGGELLVDSKEILLTTDPEFKDALIRGGIQAENSIGSTGNSKDLTILSDNLVIKNGTGISTTNFGYGTTGNIQIDSNNISISGSKSIISSRTYAIGRAGNITIDTDHLQMTDEAEIDSSTFGFARGGDITLTARSITLSGEQPAISTASNNTSVGNAGNLTINSDLLDMRDKTFIITGTSSQGTNAFLDMVENNPTLFNQIDWANVPLEKYQNKFGNGGNLTLNVNHLNIQDRSIISASTFGGGNTGDLTFTGQSVFIKGNPSRYNMGIFNEANEDSTGNAGNVTINTRSLELHDNALISASTLSTGQAGNLEINADNILIKKSTIRSESFSSNLDFLGSPDSAEAGNILININNTLFLEDKGAISVATNSANAGEINIIGGRTLKLSGDSRIVTNVANGKGAGGNILIDTPIVAIDDSFIVSRAIENNGGNITIPGHLFISPLSVIDASSKKSTPGKLNLKPDTNISGNIVVLPESLLNASEHLNDSCSSRSGNNANSFVIKNRGGIPLSPNQLSPATFMDVSSVTHHSAQKTKNKLPLFSLAENTASLLSTQQIDCLY